MELYKIKKKLKPHCHFLALLFDRAAVFNVFIVNSDEVSTVAVYFLELKFIELRIAHAH